MKQEFKVTGLRYLPAEYHDKDIAITCILVDVNNEMYENVIEIDKGGLSREKLVDAMYVAMKMCDAEVKEVIVKSIKARK